MDDSSLWKLQHHLSLMAEVSVGLRTRDTIGMCQIMHSQQHWHLDNPRILRGLSEAVHMQTAESQAGLV